MDLEGIEPKGIPKFIGKTKFDIVKMEDNGDFKIRGSQVLSYTETYNPMTTSKAELIEIMEEINNHIESTKGGLC